MDEHTKPKPLKTWCAVSEDGKAEVMIDIFEPCPLSDAVVRFP